MSTVSDDLLLTEAELFALTGYSRAAEQLNELHRQGFCRADHSDGVAELSWTVAPERRGKGVGSRMVSLAASQIDGPIRAEVKAGNEASRKIAEAAGMTLEREDGGVLYFARHTPPT